MEDYLKERKCIVVKRDNRGRCVEANEDIQKGSLISQAIVDNYILHPMYWTTKCYYCLKQLSKRNPNDVVTYDVGYNGRKEKMHVSFCNKKCVKKDYHFQYEKPHLKKLVATFLKDMSCISDLLLLSRCLRTSTEQFMSNNSKQQLTSSFQEDKKSSLLYRNSFNDLQNMVYEKNDHRDEHVQIVKTLIEIFKDGNDQIVSSSEDELQNILKREELCHPYLDTACTKANRISKLKKDYNFICQCPRCADDKTTLLVRMPNGLIHELILAIKASTNNQITDEQLNLFALQAQSTPVDLEKCLNGDIMSKDITLKENKNMRRDIELKLANKLFEEAGLEEEADRELKLLLQCKNTRSKWLHPLHLDNLSVTNNILATALLCGQYEIGIQCLLRAIDVYNCIYRYNHPMIGLKCLSLGSLFQSIGDNENAMKYLQMGKDALSITHGKDSEIVKDAIALLQTIM
eukprot:g10127.t1